MIKYLWINNNEIYRYVHPDKAREIFGEDLTKAKLLAINTVNWYIGNEVKEFAGDNIKLSTVNSKLIVLLYKLLSTLDPDTSMLSDNEKALIDNLNELAEANYSNSNLALTTINALKDKLVSLEDIITKINDATTVDEIINILEELE